MERVYPPGDELDCHSLGDHKPSLLGAAFSGRAATFKNLFCMDASTKVNDISAGGPLRGAVF
jgi:hypothetical protein